MRKKHLGFTLIELVVVMVILAILAVIAIPQFIDLRQEARNAAVSGVAGGLSSGNAINYASRIAAVNKGIAIATCEDVAGTLAGGLPANYAITAGTALAPGVTSSTCVVNFTDPVTGGITSYNFIGTGTV